MAARHDDGAGGQLASAWQPMEQEIGDKRRTPQERRSAQRRARSSLEAALQHSKAELAAIKARLLHYEQNVGEEVRMRLLASAPALAAQVRGTPVDHTDKLRRNVAQHSKAKGLNLLEATASALRKAQKGPRLDTVAMQWNLDATPYVPLQVHNPQNEAKGEVEDGEAELPPEEHASARNSHGQQLQVGAGGHFRVGEGHRHEADDGKVGLPTVAKVFPFKPFWLQSENQQIHAEEAQGQVGQGADVSAGAAQQGTEEAVGGQALDPHHPLSCALCAGEWACLKVKQKNEYECDYCGRRLRKGTIILLCEPCDQVCCEHCCIKQSSERQFMALLTSIRGPLWALDL